MKRILALIAIALILAMMPFALFSCKDEIKVQNPSQSDDADDNGSESESDLNSEDDDNDKDDEKDKDEDEEDKMTYLKLSRNAAKVRRLGRTQVLATGLACDHTASGIEFKGNFEGDVNVKIRTAMVKSSCSKTYFTVYVDGVRQSERFEASIGI